MRTRKAVAPIAIELISESADHSDAESGIYYDRAEIVPELYAIADYFGWSFVYSEVGTEIVGHFSDADGNVVNYFHTRQMPATDTIA